MVRIRFVEAPFFTAKVHALGADESLRELQVFLGEQPEAGKVIAGTGGFRKVRMALARGGKSGGARAIYLLLPEIDCVVFVLLYAKREADTISSAGKAFLRMAAAELKSSQHLLP